ncbi:MAG: NAD(P)H-dependent oxidoreductase subunit E [Bacteroidetes bacterium]|nr:MAG: NAD(P)H-dependent oxidoreductase subunit E [Bacteroidota bacterium]
MSAYSHDTIKTGKEIKFSPEAQKFVDKHLAKYPEGKKKSALLPLLHLAQQELGGWLSVDVQDYIATILNIKPIEVYEVVTFYSQYYTKPVGKYVFEVCRTSPCKLRGSDEIVEYIENKLSIKDGQTTPDGMFTLKTVECLAACGMAPVMQCGLPYHEFLTEEKVDKIINDCIAENKISRAFF